MYRRATLADPQSSLAWYNLGIMLADQSAGAEGSADYMNSPAAEAMRCYERCLAIDPSLADEDCKKTTITQFHDADVKFPLPHRVPRAGLKKYRATYRASRPCTFKK